MLNTGSPDSVKDDRKGGPSVKLIGLPVKFSLFGEGFVGNVGLRVPEGDTPEK